MKYTEHTLHRAQLKNNCPECYSNEGMVMRFIQIEKENAWYKKAEEKLIETLHCYTCHNEIFPVSWDEHIERVYEYNKKLVQPLPKGIRFKRKFWLGISLFLIVLILVLCLVYFDIK